MSKKAPWVRTYPDQAKRLSPERSQAGGVKSRSDSERVRMAVYNRIAQLFKAAYPFCQTHHIISPNIGNVARTEDVHHLRGRSGLLLFDIRSWKACCRECHNWIGANPEKATRLGLLLPRAQPKN